MEGNIDIGGDDVYTVTDGRNQFLWDCQATKTNMSSRKNTSFA